MTSAGKGLFDILIAVCMGSLPGSRYSARFTPLRR